MKPLKRLLPLLPLGLVVTTVATGLSSGLMPRPAAAQADSGGGLTIFGGVPAEYRLRYYTDFNTVRSTRARYYLEVARTKVPRDVVILDVEFPESFTENGGRLNLDAIELRQGDWRGRDRIAIQSINLFEEENRIEIIPAEPIPANTSFVVVMSNIRNPDRYGYHYFNLRMMYQGDVIDQYVGTWPMELGLN
ncbi:MAG TPA: DUF2808 domain-containing protein [Leptolyngbyaceae cyanobacterium M65_K2018_010]|nr:DUF2808 domain-containing protein [Leptolyngbyaceae cyanobacterium M65_K2018_010]